MRGSDNGSSAGEKWLFEYVNIAMGSLSTIEEMNCCTWRPLIYFFPGEKQFLIGAGDADRTRSQKNSFGHHMCPQATWPIPDLNPHL